MPRDRGSGVFKIIQTLEFYIDALLYKTNSTTISLDAVLKKTSSISFEVDARLTEVGTSTFSKSFSCDAVLVSKKILYGSKPKLVSSHHVSTTPVIF